MPILTGSPLLKRASLLAAAAIVAAVLTPLPASAQKAGQRLEAIEREIEKGRERRKELDLRAEALADELSRIRRERMATARVAQEKEVAVSDLEEQLNGLDVAVEREAVSASERRERLVRVLSVIQRLALRPPAAWIAQPGDPNDTVRGAILLRSAVPQLATTARVLRKRLAGLSALRAETGRRRQELDLARTSLADERKKLKSLFRRKLRIEKNLRAKAGAEARRLDKLAAEAKDLRDLLARLEEESMKRAALPRGGTAAGGRAGPPPRANRHFGAARGTLPFPARGRVIRRYAEKTDLGARSKGIMIETRPSAQVVATFDGRIVFAGPFRGYGQLLIIEHGEGYHTILAGMSRIEGIVGQWVLAGEPVGVMGGLAGKRPGLYVELRRKGQPINPLPWLAASENKVSG
jgi:septal ring factor EnvC (AmiA/AmiB activator)